MINKAERFWDKQAKKYDDAERQFEPVYREVIAETKKYLDSNDNVLDYGCATGTKTLELASAIKHIHGLDISAEMVNIATKKAADANMKNISFSQGTIYNKDLENASFDKIVAYGIIHLLEDCEKAIRRIFELLKPGGLFIATIACFKDKMAFKNSLEFNASLFLKKLGMFPLHLNMFKTADMEKIIVNQHFQIIEAEKMFDGITSSFIVARKP